MIDMNSMDTRDWDGPLRIGRFHVSLPYFEHLIRNRDAWGMFDHMVILEIRQPANCAMREYVALCPAFRLIDSRVQEMPLYEAWFFKNSAVPYWTEATAGSRRQTYMPERIPAPPGPTGGRMFTGSSGIVAYAVDGALWEWLPEHEAWVKRGEPPPAKEAPPARNYFAALRRWKPANVAVEMATAITVCMGASALFCYAMVAMLRLIMLVLGVKP